MLKIHDDVFAPSPELKIGYCELEGLNVAASPEEFWKKFDLLAEEVRSEFGEMKASEDPKIKSVRALYKSWRIDPSRYRPSPERLLRRILKGDELFRVNNIVDTCNYISVKYRLPIGLYDLDKVKGNLQVRFGEEGESYLGITNTVIGSHNKLIVADEEGPCGSPTTDSIRTSITSDTKKFATVVYCPEALPFGYLVESLDEYIHTLNQKEEDHVRQICKEYFVKKTIEG